MPWLGKADGSRATSARLSAGLSQLSDSSFARLGIHRFSQSVDINLGYLALYPSHSQHSMLSLVPPCRLVLSDHAAVLHIC